MALLEIRNLKIEFGRGPGAVRAVDGVSLEIQPGRSLALVGESGSGKSVTALSIARLIPSPPARYCSGEILVEGRDVLRMTSAELRQIRGGVVSYIFQEPGASLNPLFRIGAQIKEALKLHRSEAATDAEVIRLLKLVGISAPEERRRSYPHQISGGMQQRVMIAIALACQPKLLVADEPTTALDVTIQAQIIELLAQLKAELSMSILLITHNLGIVGDLADDLAVMNRGRILEHGPARQVLKNPAHPYTQALIAAVPTLEDQGFRKISSPERSSLSVVSQPMQASVTETP
jgi:ABC-type dipeptide/oligopeptide/nickel transport system ATPase component